MTQDIIDLPEVLERVQNDRDLLLELLDIFLSDCPSKIKAITEAVHARDFEKLKEVSHSMKGASGNISAKKIHAAFLAIEQKAKTNTLDGLDKILKDLDGHMNDLQSYSLQLKEEFKKT